MPLLLKPTHMQCDSNGNITRFDCPEEPPVVIETGSIIVRLFLLILRMVGAHGIVGFFGGILLVLGFVKLLFGGIICCRKTKAQKHYDEQIAKGVDPKGNHGNTECLHVLHMLAIHSC